MRPLTARGKPTSNIQVENNNPIESPGTAIAGLSPNTSVNTGGTRVVRKYNPITDSYDEYYIGEGKTSLVNAITSSNFNKSGKRKFFESPISSNIVSSHYTRPY